MPAATSDVKTGFFIMIGILLAIIAIGVVARLVSK